MAWTLSGNQQPCSMNRGHKSDEQIEMGTAEHLALQKFEPVDVSLRNAITPGQGAGSVNSGIVSTNPVDKAGEFRHLTLLCLLEPALQCLCLMLFEQRHKFLTQQIDGAEVRTCLTDVLDVFLFLGRQFLWWQNHQQGSTPGGKTPLPSACRKEAWFPWTPLLPLGWQFCAPLAEEPSKSRLATGIATLFDLSKELRTVVSTRLPLLTHIRQIGIQLALPFGVPSSPFCSFREGR